MILNIRGTINWKTIDGCGPHTVVNDNVAPFGNLVPALNLSEAELDSAVGGSYTLPAVGNFGYHCGIHGGNPVDKTGDMWGIIHVVDES